MKLLHRLQSSPVLVKRLMVVVCVLVGLVALNLNLGKFQSVQQYEFERWLARYDSPVAGGATTEGVVPDVVVSMKIEGKLPGMPALLWEISSATDAARRAQALRLLQLARAGNIFSIQANENNPEVLRVIMHEGEQEFRGVIDQASVERNVAVASFLRLFQEYATNPAASGVVATPNPLFAEGGKQDVPSLPSEGGTP